MYPVFFIGIMITGPWLFHTDTPTVFASGIQAGCFKQWFYDTPNLPYRKWKSGITTVLDLIRFDERLEGVDLVVTGEGRTDWQSCFGKVMQGVGVRSKAKGVPVLGLFGSLGKNALDICDHGVGSLMTTVNGPMTVEEAMARAEELYYEGAVRMFRFVKIEIKQVFAKRETNPTYASKKEAVYTSIATAQCSVRSSFLEKKTRYFNNRILLINKTSDSAV